MLNLLCIFLRHALAQNMLDAMIGDDAVTGNCFFGLLR